MSDSHLDDRCSYTYPEDYEVGDDPDHQSCCWRETVPGAEECIWHADPDKVEKSVEALREAQTPPEIREKSSPYAELLDGANLSDVELGGTIPFMNCSLRKSVFTKSDLEDANLSGANLRRATLAGADLRGADLSGADLKIVNFTDADLEVVNFTDADFYLTTFTDADLREADLSGTDLQSTKFSDADLRGADLSDADLRTADFVNADLRGADLSEAELRRVDLTNADLRDTTLYRVDLRDASLLSANLWSIDPFAVSFQRSDLSGANLGFADLSEVILRDADLSGANLEEADLTETDLDGANLSGANIEFASLSSTNLQGSDLRGAKLKGGYLSNTNLRGADLSGVDLRETYLEDVSMDGSTTCKILYEGYDHDRITTQSLIPIRPRWLSGNSSFDSEDWDATARAYHTLKTTFNEYGLVGKARRHHIWERGARRCEAKTADDILARFFSLIAWQAAGYGVSVRRVFRNMMLVFSVATLAYLWFGISEDFSTVPEILYYSVITFTTTPPEMPDNEFVKAIVMTEAFLGTLLVVFLGYVLGTRERF